MQFAIDSHRCLFDAILQRKYGENESKKYLDKQNGNFLKSPAQFDVYM